LKARSVREKDIPITVVVPIKNEERTLADCLSRLRRFAHVIVVDSGSTDRSVEIARCCNAEVVQFEWDGRYPKKRNWMLINHTFVDAWVLFLDADELVSDEFCNEVADIDGKGHSGYWLNYTNHFLGRRLRHGLPQRKLALFRLGSGLYERIEEEAWSQLDMEIHEHPVIDGTLGEIRAPIEHNDFRGLDHFISKHRDYARWEAHRVLLLGGNLEAGKLTRRQRFKYRHVASWWYAWFYFLYVYVARLGFLDGAAGFQYAFHKAWYFNTIRLFVEELRAAAGQRPADEPLTFVDRRGADRRSD
jgi:glycosyltransferase involved in cell wall biosynthesis